MTFRDEVERLLEERPGVSWYDVVKNIAGLLELSIDEAGVLLFAYAFDRPPVMDKED